MNKNISFALHTLIVSILLAVMSACNKKASAYNPEFVGTWRATIVVDSTNNIIRYNEIIIEERDGLFKFYCSSLCEDSPCNCTSEESGRAVISTDEKSLKIGTNGTVLSIDQEPYVQLGEWKMKIQGTEYIRL
jgi:hypothetical protein